MANFINITLDKTAPVLLSIAIGSVERTNSTGHNVSFEVSGGADVAQYKLWGNASGEFSNPSAVTEIGGSWVAFDVLGTPNDVAVTINGATDGSKKLYAKVRDDVGNESGSSFDTIYYDASGPTLASISINSGAEKSGSTGVLVSFNVSPSDAYVSEFLVWGDLANGETSKSLAEAGAGWVAFDVMGTPNESLQYLTIGDGIKSLTAVVRDDLANESSDESDSIELDQTAPIVQIQSGPTPSKISLVSGFDTSVFSWYWEAVGTDVGETGLYQIEVGTNASGMGFGTVIPTTGGSENITGSLAAAGTGTPESAAADTGNHILTTVKGADLDAAGAEGSNRVNIYISDNVGNVTPYNS